MNFDEYMNCQNKNNGYVDNNFGAEDPCFSNDFSDYDPTGCNCDDPDDKYISNGLDGKDHCWRPDPVKPLPNYGQLNVFTNLDCPEGDPIANAPVSLYKIDNGCEKLVATKKTDKNGMATFKCLANGFYRVEQELDPCLFECPKYYPSSQFAIRPGHKDQEMYIVQKRKTVDPCLMRTINKAVNAAVRKALGCNCR